MKGTLISIGQFIGVAVFGVMLLLAGFYAGKPNPEQVFEQKIGAIMVQACAASAENGGTTFGVLAWQNAGKKFMLPVACRVTQEGNPPAIVQQ